MCSLTLLTPVAAPSPASQCASMAGTLSKKPQSTEAGVIKIDEARHQTFKGREALRRPAAHHRTHNARVQGLETMACDVSETEPGQVPKQTCAAADPPPQEGETVNFKQTGDSRCHLSAGSGSETIEATIVDGRRRCRTTAGLPSSRGVGCSENWRPTIH